MQALWSARKTMRMAQWRRKKIGAVASSRSDSYESGNKHLTGASRIARSGGKSPRGLAGNISTDISVYEPSETKYEEAGGGEKDDVVKVLGLTAGSVSRIGLIQTSAAAPELLKKGERTIMNSRDADSSLAPDNAPAKEWGWNRGEAAIAALDKGGSRGIEEPRPEDERSEGRGSENWNHREKTEERERTATGAVEKLLGKLPLSKLKIVIGMCILNLLTP